MVRSFGAARPACLLRKDKKICALFIAPEAIPDDNMEAMAIKENKRDEARDDGHADVEGREEGGGGGDQKGINARKLAQKMFW